MPLDLQSHPWSPCCVPLRFELGWAELPKHKAITVGQVCLSRDQGSREAKPHQAQWGQLDLAARTEGTEVPQGWRSGGVLIRGAVGPTLGVIWVLGL